MLPEITAAMKTNGVLYKWSPKETPEEKERKTEKRSAGEEAGQNIESAMVETYEGWSGER
ncbi:MAG: hypothetical protein R3D26_00865 [Cyanobacteriota/Melainabacteria group bacterium]